MKKKEVGKKDLLPSPGTLTNKTTFTISRRKGKKKSLHAEKKERGKQNTGGKKERKVPPRLRQGRLSPGDGEKRSVGKGSKETNNYQGPLKGAQKKRTVMLTGKGDKCRESTGKKA